MKKMYVFIYVMACSVGMDVFGMNYNKSIEMPKNLYNDTHTTWINHVQKIYYVNLANNKQIFYFYTEKLIFQAELSKELYGHDTLKAPQRMKTHDGAGIPFSIVTNEEQSFLDRIRDMHKGKRKKSIPCIAKDEKGNYKVVGDGRTLYAHNKKVAHIYNEALLIDNKISEAVVVTGSIFPSIYMWKQQVVGSFENNTFEVKEELKKFPGYYLIAVNENRIVYAKHPTKSSLISRLFASQAETNSGLLYTQELIDKKGNFCDLEKGEMLAKNILLPEQNNTFEQGAANKNAVVFVDEGKNMHLYLYRKIGQWQGKQIEEDVTAHGKCVTNPFLIKNREEEYLIWFTASNHVCWVDLTTLYNKQMPLNDVGQIPIHSASLSGNLKQKLFGFTYDKKQKAFYFIVAEDTQSQGMVRTLEKRTIESIVNKEGEL